MSIYKNKVLVVDVEATCWEDHVVPEGQFNEIIEIGVCVLILDTLCVEDKRSLFVRPIFSEISPFCTTLTGITTAQITQHGMDFSDACAILEQDYNTRNLLWASWGAWDRKLFQQQCQREKVRYPFSDKHANLKRVYADAIGTREGMLPALTTVGLTSEGVAHRADDDAWNAARILARLITDKSMTILRKYGI